MSAFHICVLLNGPPGCGKDTLANLLAEHGFHHHRYKEQLYTDTANYYGVPVEEFRRWATDRILKELVHRALGVSPREAMIHVSESVFKPRYGNAYFGHAAAQRCVQQRSGLAVFSDSGFAEEVTPMQALYDHVVVFRLHREGFTFGSDSRRYLQGYPNTYDLTLEDDRPQDAVNSILASVVQLRYPQPAAEQIHMTTTEHHPLDALTGLMRIVESDDSISVDSNTMADVFGGLSKAQTLCHGLAARSGWWMNLETHERLTPGQVNIPEKLMLIVSEVAEAMEGHRRGLMDDKLPDRPMLEVELADTLIRVFDLAGFLELDLAGAVIEKLAFNQTRADHQVANRLAAGGKKF